MNSNEVLIQHAIWFMLMGMIARTMGTGHWADYTHRRPLMIQCALMVFSCVMFLYGFALLAYQIIGAEWTAFMIIVVIGVWALADLSNNNDDDFDGD